MTRQITIDNPYEVAELLVWLMEEFMEAIEGDPEIKSLTSLRLYGLFRDLIIEELEDVAYDLAYHLYSRSETARKLRLDLHERDTGAKTGSEKNEG